MKKPIIVKIMMGGYEDGCPYCKMAEDECECEGYNEEEDEEEEEEY